MLLDALQARLAQIPEAQRPKFVLFGESLGAWTSQDPFVDQGTQGLVDTGIDHAIWIGTPHFSKWKEQVLFDGRPDVDAATVRTFSNISEWHALDPEERAGIRYVMITHHDDGVALFGPELMIQAPPWLGPRDSRPHAGAEGDALDADDGVLPGARGHEELGQRRAREVRGEGPRLPRRPAPVLPRRARLRRPPRPSSMRSRCGSRPRSCSAASGSPSTARPARAWPRP